MNRLDEPIKEYCDSHMTDKELLVTIRKAVDFSPELRRENGAMGAHTFFNNWTGD